MHVNHAVAQRERNVQGRLGLVAVYGHRVVGGLGHGRGQQHLLAHLGEGHLEVELAAHDVQGHKALAGLHALLAPEQLFVGRDLFLFDRVGLALLGLGRFFLFALGRRRLGIQQGRRKEHADKESLLHFSVVLFFRFQ